ncbi:MAG: helix-turn-helix transcriptional regulator [Polyangiaceae bacterium]|nr:helix-turn-helix transcriptional regulator [Polyangiaceae bacterium]
MRNEEPRSFCPINMAVEVLGDTWTLLILRDMMFAGKRHFRDLLQCEERIASNILADRLRLLTLEKVITKSEDPTHKQKAIYSLTEKGIQLLPVLVQIRIWGAHHMGKIDAVSPAVKAFNRKLERGGPELWAQMMAELRATHLGR